MEKVSVIVPVYNVEKYIERCLKSIISQTYENLEIIVVNDGTKDNSEKIIKNIQQKDKRIKYYVKENGGLSDARNYGIDKATGKYVCFIDSDDYIEKTYVEDLYNSLKENNTKIACCYMQQTDGKNVIKIYKQNKDDVLSFEMASACNKLFDMSLFKDIRFPKNLWYEDLATTPKIIMKIKDFSLVQKPLYNYYVNNNSITHSYDKADKILDMIEVIDGLENYYQENHLDNYYCNLEYINLFHGIIGTTFRMIASKKYSKSEILSYVSNIEKKYPKIYSNKIAKERLSLKLKIYTILIKLKLINLIRLLIRIKER